MHKRWRSVSYTYGHRNKCNTKVAIGQHRDEPENPKKPRAKSCDPSKLGAQIVRSRGRIGQINMQNYNLFPIRIQIEFFAQQPDIPFDAIADWKQDDLVALGKLREENDVDGFIY